MRVAGYEFSDGARFQSGAPHDKNAAKSVGEHLEFLRQQFKGEITPKDVLDDARNPNSPLHPYFEWSDTDAAEQYRLQQARGLIRAVVAIYVSDDKPAKRQKAYVHIAEGSTPHYREAGHAMSVKSTRDIVLRQAWREFQAWRKRYKDLKEFSELFDAAEQVEMKLLDKVE